MERGDPNGPSHRRTYGDLDRRARSIAATLRRTTEPEARVLLLFAPGLEFIEAFFGCLYAGVVAVPAYPPDPARLERTLPRLTSIAGDCGASAVLTQGFVASMRAALPTLPESLAQCPWIAVDELSDEGFDAPRTQPDAVAFLQYTSGSTGTPRGVMVTHGNLTANITMISRAMALTPEDVVVSWLPLFHDMGLIGTVLTTLCSRTRVVMMSPLHFLKKPMAWLGTISTVRATISGGPNFAYGLCCRRVTPPDLESLDLSSWRVAFNGAEPVDPATMQRFTELFSPAGFSADAVFPTYGLAEATLLVSGGPAGTGMRAEQFSAGLLEHGVVDPDDGGRALCSCGEVADDSVRVVDPDTQAPIGDDRIGEIWVRGEHVAAGYWSAAPASAQTFGATLGDRGGWLRTGDLGFIRDGHLWVTGRIKDLVIINGRNITPHDVERIAAAAHPDVRTGSVAAFGVPTMEGEGLGLMLETTIEGPALEPIVAAIRRAVSEQLGIAIVDVWPVPKRSLPKTSSGKLQRSACRAAFLERPQPASPWSASPESAAVGDAPTTGALGLILDELVRQTGLSRSELRPSATLAELGIDSVAAAALASTLESHLGRPVAAGGMPDRTLTDLAAWLEDGRRPTPSTPRPDWRARDVSHFRRATGRDLFEIHGHFARWIAGARPGGYDLYDMRLEAAPDTTVGLLTDDRRYDELINLASYNYLGLATHPEVTEAAAAAVRRYGLSASGSPMLSGRLEVHHALERELAEFKGLESALLFPTGYSTNVGVISALVGPGDTVIADALVHASIVDGVAMSQANMAYFRHNDLSSLERALARHGDRTLVAVEGVYSMDGDLAPLPGIAELCRRHGARLLVDEAHSAFVFGPNGRGAVEHFDVEHLVDVHVGTLSKSLGGMGGYVAGSRQVIDYIRAYARSHTFSCALSPPVASGLRTALAVVRAQPGLRHRLWDNVAIMREALISRRVDIGDSQSQVLPVLIRDDDRIFDIARDLLDAGVYLNPVRYPAVKKHHARFRISVSTMHTPQQLERGAAIIAEVLQRHGVIR